MDRGMEKMAPPPVPTHRRPEMMVRDEIWRGDSDKKGWPTKEKKIHFKLVVHKIKVPYITF